VNLIQCYVKHAQSEGHVISDDNEQANHQQLFAS